jgi:hypothetical protein
VTSVPFVAKTPAIATFFSHKKHKEHKISRTPAFVTSVHFVVKSK